MEPHLHPHPLWPVPHIPEPHICCLRATGQVREAGGKFACHAEQGPVSIPPHLLGPLFLLGGKRVEVSLLFMELPPAASASGRAGCCSTSRSLSHSRMLLSLSTSSFSSAIRLSRSFTCSHRTQPFRCLCCPWDERQAQALPAARDLDTCVLAQGLLLARAFPRVVTIVRMSPGWAMPTT